jgi:predicted MPP superfamily phosphohydrolase
MTRRQWLRRVTAGASASGAALGLYTWRIEPHWVELVRRRLPVARLPRQLDGRLLVQVSDIHVGFRVDDDYLIDTFRRIAALAPAFVVYTGDFMSYDGSPELGHLSRIVRHLPRGRLGTAGILGNHDYGRRWSEIAVADRVCQLATNAGITMLRNQSTMLSGLQLVGLEDFWGPRFAPRDALEQSDPREATVVLCHNPDAVDVVDAWAGYTGWILAGHTHGGQVRPPFLPPPLLPVRNRRYTSGEIPLSGGRRLYINRGLGHLKRVRFNCRPEVTLFELTRA